MIDDWRMKFHQGSGGQTEDDFPFGFVQVCRYHLNFDPSVCPCLHTDSVLRFLLTSVSEGYISLYSNPFPTQYTTSPSLIHHFSVLAAVYFHQEQHIWGVPRNPLAPNGRLWLCSKPADEENLHGCFSGSTGWNLALQAVGIRTLHYIWIVTLSGDYLCLINQWRTCQVQGFWGPSPYCVHPV